MRMSRRLGLYSGDSSIDLATLWANARGIGMLSRSASSEATITATIGNTASPMWAWYSTGKAIEIAKFKNNEKTLLKYVRVSTSYTATTAIASGSTTATTKIDLSAAYGKVLILFDWPSVSEATVDTLLSGMTLNILASRYSAATGSVSISDSTPVTNRLYVQELDGTSTGCWSICAGSDQTTAVSRYTDGDFPGTYPFWFNNTRGTIYLSRSGNANASSRAGNICELY